MVACSPASSSCVCRNSKGKFKGAGGGTASFQPRAGMFVGGGGRARDVGRISQREEGGDEGIRWGYYIISARGWDVFVGGRGGPLC
jgi:hypothetical protein